MAEQQILVIGGASLDKLDGADGIVPGGAGMYTAMSAHRCKAVVTLYAPRPIPIPDELAAVAEKVTWIGPSIAPEDIAHFEISYEDGFANYVTAQFGTEESLSTDELPADLSGFDCVHLIPLGDIRRQLALLRICRDRGAKKISAGTALDLINVHPAVAADVADEADILFMNEDEAVRLYGSLPEVRSRPDQLIYVTHGKDGATVVQGDSQTRLSSVAVSAIDPTGAGDTFCGATIVGIASGLHPVSAARRAMPLAAEMITEIGPATLLRALPPPQPVRDDRVVVNSEQTGHVAELIRSLHEASPFDFVGPDLPPVGHPAALDFFFASALQQFGFWTHANGSYERPLIATMDGEQRKGAFYLFRAYCRWLRDDPERLTPAAQAQLSRADLLNVLRDDEGNDPMPALELHLSMARNYGRDMTALGHTAAALIETANSMASPIDALLGQLDRIGGYKEDPLRKKSALLAIILRQRPEVFLVDRGDDAPPIVDYHVMRSCLRIGLVDVVDPGLASKLRERRLLTEAEEWAVRSASFSAVEQLVQRSGKTLGAVDWFLFQARQRCPEMSEPDCASCTVDARCMHRKDLFQPVLRTSFY